VDSSVSVKTVICLVVFMGPLYLGAAVLCILLVFGSCVLKLWWRIRFINPWCPS